MLSVLTSLSCPLHSSLCLFRRVPDGRCFLLRVGSSWLSPRHGQACPSSSANLVFIFDLCPLPSTPTAHILSPHTHTHTHTHTPAACTVPACSLLATCLAAFKSRSSLCPVVPGQMGRLCPGTRGGCAQGRGFSAPLGGSPRPPSFHLWKSHTSHWWPGASLGAPSTRQAQDTENPGVEIMLGSSFSEAGSFSFF